MTKGCRGRRLYSQSRVLHRCCGDSVGMQRNDSIETGKNGTSITHIENNIGRSGETCRDRIELSLAYLNRFRCKHGGQLEKSIGGQVREAGIDPVGKRSQWLPL